MSTTYQTLNGFLLSPFNNEIKDNRPDEYENKYQIFKRSNKIQVIAILEMNDSYFIHVKIPSESHIGNTYDVVIQFFQSERSKPTELNIEDYYIKFFSNSPSFVYKYAAVYYANDYLIDALDSLYDKEALQKPPEKTNAKMELYYDKSIYFACRFLQDHRKQYLSKIGMAFKRITNFERFMSKIQDTETIQINSTMSQLERSVKKGIESDKKAITKKSTENKKNSRLDIHRKDKVQPIKSNTKKSSKPKIKSKKSTFRD